MIHSAGGQGHQGHWGCCMSSCSDSPPNLHGPRFIATYQCLFPDDASICMMWMSELMSAKDDQLHNMLMRTENAPGGCDGLWLHNPDGSYGSAPAFHQGMQERGRALQPGALKTGPARGLAATCCHSDWHWKAHYIPLSTSLTFRKTLAGKV